MYDAMKSLNRSCILFNALISLHFPLHVNMLLCFQNSLRTFFECKCILISISISILITLPSPWIFNHEFLQLKDQIFLIFFFFSFYLSLPFVPNRIRVELHFLSIRYFAKIDRFQLVLGAQNKISQLGWWNNQENVF
jgi:hypothetical protein